MKIQSIQVLVVFALAASALAAEPSAESLKKCPSGHATLKDVPIAYGFPPSQGPDAEKWRKGVENLEIVLGGCAVSDDSPKHAVICTTCGFDHRISSTRRPQDGSWTRHSPDAESFPKSFSDVVKSFPVPTKEQQKEPLTYTQSLSDSLEVKYECVGYSTTKPANEVKAGVNQWLKEHNITCSFSSHTFTNIVLGVNVRELLEWKREQPWVWITMVNEYSDKTSRISATFFRRP